MGRTPPALVVPPRTRWTREEIAEWLKCRLGEGQRLLIGIDFAFGFPYEGCGYLGGRAEGIEDIFALWDLIEAKSEGEADFGCTRFVSDPEYVHLFWKAGPKPERWVERKRRTEHACAESTQTRADTLYNIRMDVRGANFSVEVQGQMADSWTEPHLTRGGVGFFTARGEVSRVRWVQITHQYDMLGRLCAYLAPYDTTNGSWQP